jgi:excisionase family DNA binding protein
MEKKEITIADTIQQINERQKRIEKMILSQKNVLTFEEAAGYIGISKSHLYKLTMNKSLPFYRPRGKMIYFDKNELDNWLLQNPITPNAVLEA